MPQSAAWPLIAALAMSLTFLASLIWRSRTRAAPDPIHTTTPISSAASAPDAVATPDNSTTTACIPHFTVTNLDCDLIPQRDRSDEGPIPFQYDTGLACEILDRGTIHIRPRCLGFVWFDPNGNWSIISIGWRGPVANATELHSVLCSRQSDPEKVAATARVTTELSLRGGRSVLLFECGSYPSPRIGLYGYADTETEDILYDLEIVAPAR